MTKAFDSAVRLLARREHGAMELYDKLQKNGYSGSDARDAIDRCQELGLQSDARFVESYSRSRIRQGYGPVKIRQELKSKGIDSDLIQSELDKERDNWSSYALDVWQKKTKGHKDWSYNELQKHQKFLLYRGFSMDTIIMIMKDRARME